ncbi:MAG: BatA domain-containing protein [Planctomycetaceae bacterium]|nr:BatA domain-containing protein [Planctomycetaceae bacterium]
MMTFLNAGMLAGLGAILVPLILHFLLRQKPKRILFPALRLLERKRKQNVRRLRLRHLWLLLLRMLVFAAIVLAVARPSLPPANYSLNSWEITTLLVVVAVGAATYFLLLRRWKPILPPAQFDERRSSLRGWLTGLTLLLIAFAVGYPYQRRIAAEITDPSPSTPLDVPVAGVFLFDASLSMEYQQEGDSRLTVAREIAERHLEELPQGSRIAVADNAADHPINFQSTLHAAKSRLSALEPRAVSGPLEDRLRDALRAQQDDQRRVAAELGGTSDVRAKDRYVRRVYLFTDLASSAWRGANSARLQADLDKFPNINLYLIDVGSEEPQNLAVADVHLSRQRVALGGDLIVSADIEATGIEEGERVFELLLTQPDGSTTKHGQVQTALENGVPKRIEFPVLTGVTGPLLHGEVRIVDSDPLEIDNARYFSAVVTAPPKVLVVAPNERDAAQLMAALAPYDKQNASRNRFEPVYASVNRLREMDLPQFEAVCLINVPRLADSSWYQLGKYVENGGGLLIFTGSDDTEYPVFHNRAQAQTFLPATLDVWQTENDFRFHISDRQHALFWKFRQYESYGSFAMFENEVWVSRFWKVAPAEGSTVLATYTDDQRSPAIIERSFGRGRTILFTTAVNLPDSWRQRWTNLPSPLLAPWLFVAFSEQLTEYVSRFTDSPYNYVTGETPVVLFEPQPAERQFWLREPLFKQRQVSLGSNEPALKIDPPNAPGHYELLESVNGPPLGGFSVNIQSDESDLTRLTEQQLDDILGEGRYQLARNIEELDGDIIGTDIGQELYPVLLMLLIVGFLGEHFVANWFYQLGQHENQWDAANAPQPNLSRVT